uniref:Uncharacterized protein n=1 Tax=Rhizophora mucronata TaxID=61149 RepID=A0A2P2PX69_RHIMU
MPLLLFWFHLLAILLPFSSLPCSKLWMKLRYPVPPHTMQWKVLDLSLRIALLLESLQK